MSRIGSKPVKIPEGIDIKIEDKSRYGGQKIIVKGPLGELMQNFREGVKCKLDGNQMFFERVSDSKFNKSLHGLYRTLVANMIDGVVKGYEKELEMVGIGYRSELEGTALKVTVGATHPFVFDAPEGITFEVNDKVNIKIKGINKQLVGQIAANIRAIAKPEPYKGKGIRYKGEYIRRKAGKAAKAAEGAGE